MDNNLKAMRQAGMKPERNFIRIAVKEGELMPTIDISKNPMLIDEDNPDLTHPEPWKQPKDNDMSEDEDEDDRMPALLPRKRHDESDSDDDDSTYSTTTK